MSRHDVPGPQRQYGVEYREYHGKPEKIKERAQRNAARSQMEKAGRVSKGDGKDVDHKKRIKHGGGNSPSNLRVASPAVNRARSK